MAKLFWLNNLTENIVAYITEASGFARKLLSKKTKGWFKLKLLSQIAIILIISYIGDTVSKLLSLPIPGNVLGMAILLACLGAGVIKVEMVDRVSKLMLDNLSFFFIPVTVGLITLMDLLHGKWLAIVIICLFSTVVTMVSTGLTVQLLGRKLNK
ncbi:CidA/LrgA family protein [Thermincola ferriacetica]|uniref:CidA/LrgA family protein n=1 Tax=Thermincola ferriacetica TaxID=281456 RepID=UPI001FA73B94|nr:CidA/LrgA family protein [Thermincola ferriacetica]